MLEPVLHGADAGAVAEPGVDCDIDESDRVTRIRLSRDVDSSDRHGARNELPKASKVAEVEQCQAVKAAVAKPVP